MSQQRAWRWRNVPVPEPHVAALTVGLLLHRLRPRGLGGRPALRPVGAGLVAAGVATVVWATASAGPADLDRSDELVTDGAYRYSRNPMYVGWTLIYLGVAGMRDSSWPLVVLPGLAAAIHREVRHEEERLAARFGPTFAEYATQVRRYL